MIAILALAGPAAAQSFLVLADEEAAPAGWAEVLVHGDRDDLEVRLAQSGESALTGDRVCRTPCALALRPQHQELWVSGRGRTPATLWLRPLPDARYVVVGRTRSAGRNWAGRGLVVAGLGLAAGGVVAGLRPDQPTRWSGGPLAWSLLGSGAAAFGVGLPLAWGSASELTVVRP